MVDVYVKCSQPAPIRFSRRAAVCGSRQGEYLPAQSCRRPTRNCRMSEPTPPHSREHYTAAYDNVAAVPDVQALVEGFRERSRLVYAHHACERDIPYGLGPRQLYDWFAASGGRQSEETAPVLVFIHGGYWQWRTKEDFACVATGPLSAGMHVILAEYTLAPQARMPAIVAEIGALLDALARHPVLGVRTGESPRVVLAGHSAGGHLAAMHRSHPTVAGVLAISGIFELDPIARGALNETLQLGNAGVVACSPKRHIARGAPTCIAVGGNGIAGIAAPEPTLCHRLTCCGRARGSARRPSAKSLTSTSWRNWKAPRAVWLRRLSAYPIETREGLHNQRRNAS